MAKINIWMPLYVGDYLSDTAHLQTPQHGAYLLLLMHQWHTGKGLPDDLDAIIQIAKVRSFFVDASSIAEASLKHSTSIALASDSKEQIRLRAWMHELLTEFFVQQPDGRWMNNRAELERIAWADKQEIHIQRAKKAAAARWNGHIAKRKPAAKRVDATSIAQGQLMQSPSPSPLSTKASTKVASLPGPGKRGGASASDSGVGSLEREKKANTRPTAGKRAGSPVDESELPRGARKQIGAAAPPPKSVARDVKTGVRPAKASTAKDVRFGSFRAEIFKYWKAHHQDHIQRGLVPADPPWGGRDGAELNLFLEANPGLQLDMFVRLLMNRSGSDVVHSEAPYKWIRDLMGFASGRLNKFKQPKR